MLEAKLIMDQAAMTADSWGVKARRFVDEWFDDYPPSARATIIAAYMNTAAGDEIAMHLRCLAKAVEDINLNLGSFIETRE